MIDREARKAAMAISQGRSVEAGDDSKVALYGLLGRVLDPASLGGGLNLIKTPESFGDLEAALLRRLKGAAHAGFMKSNGTYKVATHNLLSERVPNARDCVGGLALSGLVRLIQGCGTAAHTEVTTLRTIAHGQVSGQEVSEKGLYASAKVPFLVAMMHLKDHMIDRENYDVWTAAEGGDGGHVFRAGDVSLDRNSGLNLANIPEDLASAEDVLEHGPRIGCPVTLVKGYVRRIHEISAVAALESGLIEVS